MPYQRREPRLHGEPRFSEHTPTWSTPTQGAPKPAFHWTMLIDTPQKLIALVTVLLCAFGTGLYVLLTPPTAVQGPTSIPLVQPTEGQIKVLPENPGGIQVPHQDKMIYDRLEGQNPSDERAQLTVEEEVYPSLDGAQPQATGLPSQMPPVTPPSPPQATVPQEIAYEAWPKAAHPHLAAKLKQGQPPALAPAPLPAGTPQATLPVASPQGAPLSPAEGKIPAQAPQNLMPAEDAIAELLEQAPPQPAPGIPDQGTLPPQGVASMQGATVVGAPKVQEPQGPAPTAQAPKAPAKAAPLKRPMAPKIAKGKTLAKQGTGPISRHFRIQMASLPNKSAAEAEMKRLWSQNKAVLGKYKGAVTRIAGEKGTYYKVIAGPLASGDVARALCKKLAHHKTACFVMKPQA